ncbi:MAG: glycoside hydrolase family 3 C-terminal domain-containing protein [Bacteroidales bacterium]|jgi:beta-glucosidase|nr:glycoside hydrolase family 3 C-terminal domain-containing protein [Bacteroidales bacterium]
MKRKKVILLLMSLCALSISGFSQDNRAEALLKTMTLEEKVGQMAQITIDVIGKGPNPYSSFEPFEIDTVELRTAVKEYHVGSILNTSNNRALTLKRWNEVISEIQDVATKETRTKIPVIYGIDAIHGATYLAEATMFPQNIGLAATFNPDYARKMAEICAYETRASGIPWVLSPALDLGADPRFSRQQEGFGEDPYLVTVMGEQVIKGYEGDYNDINNPYHVISCPKHFLGYSTSLSGKDRTPAYIPEIILREYHLPPFRKAIEAGANTVMINSGIINGVSVHSSYDLITKLLKQELGFDGVVVSDWNDIENLHRRDRIAKDDKEAIKIAINAGIDMSMIPYDYKKFCNGLVELVNSGEVSMQRIDEAVLRILKLKIKTGLLENPVTSQADYSKVGSDEFGQYAYYAAAESITLLKNKDNILPLKKDSKILVVGPNADNMRTLNGSWTYSWQGEKTDEFAGRFNTIREALKNTFSNVDFIAGVSYNMEGKYYEENKDKFDKAVAASKRADVVILCLGENTYSEKPGDLNDLTLSDMQLELATAIADNAKKVILVLNEGRPRIIRKIEPEMDAIIQIYLPGNYGGDALADILVGKVNPSGKLPYNYPSYPNSLVNYYHKPAEEQIAAEGVYNYESDYNPQYEFGFGLSYTTFEYSNMKVSRENEKILVSVDVKNTGKVGGKEVVQLYSSDLFASMTPDMKRLRRFSKINLKPQEKKTVTFELMITDLAFINADGKSIVEAGDFELGIGTEKVLLTL